jgi:hypothetical protein
MHENVLIMQRTFGGSALVNGGERRLTIVGSPLGRTTIQVDGVTVFDKKPFVARETIDFDIIPGKKATLRWQQVSLTGLECDITVDGRTATLAPVTESGAPAKPVSAQQREQFKIRMLGVGFAALGACFIVLNYFELQRGAYYPNYLMVSPLLLVSGCITLAKPRLDFSSAASRKYAVALAVGMLIVGRFFCNWFLSTFAP